MFSHAEHCIMYTELVLGLHTTCSKHYTYSRNYNKFKYLTKTIHTDFNYYTIWFLNYLNSHKRHFKKTHDLFCLYNNIKINQLIRITSKI